MDLSARFLSLALGGAGWVLWLLIALSVISLAISLERLWYFRTHRVQKATLLADMQALLRERASVDGEGLAPPRADVAAAAEGAKAREKLRLERNLAFLATLGLERAVRRAVRHGARDHQGVPRPGRQPGRAARRWSWPASRRRWSPPPSG